MTWRSPADEGRRALVRMHPTAMKALELEPGQAARLSGSRSTVVRVIADETTGQKQLHADDLTFGNAGVPDGGPVTVTPIPLTAASRVILSGPPGVHGTIPPEMLRQALFGKTVSPGDDVSLLSQEVFPDRKPPVSPSTRSSLSSRFPWWTNQLLTVESVDDGVLVTTKTVVGWQDGPATATAREAAPETPAAGTPAEVPPPSLEDLVGLRAQAKELQELLDLGFNHREVLAKLHTRVALGILVSGPSGSGKGGMVRAVAATVGAEVRLIWAPELAALTNDAAARRLREAAAAIRGDKPAVLLVSDVEALAPRDEPGPIATVFRQVLAELVAGGAAVVCTTGRPESVDPELRAPDLLAVQLTVPLPDAAMRREQLTVLTRGMPLAADVRLDDVAGRTPGYVAADLGALVREAGVRAALRQKTSDEPSVTMADFEAALDVVRPTSMAESTLEVATVTLDDVGDMAEVKQVLTESVLWPLTYPDTFARLGVTPPRGVLLYGPPGCGKTYLVKAIAGTGKANVLSVKGAELLSKWVGDSEKAVRELFRRAREAAPTLVFLDEVDALAPARGQGSDGGVTDRVVAALLTELDGVEDLRNVVVIGATNRPDLIDPALLRPGRLERLVYVPPPDGPARAAILRASAKSVPLDESVDLTALGEELTGFSAADCSALIREAALAAMRGSLEASTVTAANVSTARERVRASLDAAQVAWLESYAEKRNA
ncbi:MULTISPECIES: AAA family ATPase [unclassified Actinoplanes]|uniref:AAA family ATPase n=1 Tax=unclassified Actinoplanes TaxID=2626549 RepID=UPI0005BA337B|nr:MULTISPECIES: AAA family ATPase [unclassified Actinoplanes]